MEENPAEGEVTQGRTWWLAAGAVTGAVVTVLLVLLVVSLLDSAEPEAGPAPRFVEESQAAGLAHVYDGDFEFFVGGGVAVFDCDGDGDQDVYMSGGSNPAGLYRNESEVGGRLAFIPAGDAVTDTTGVVGAYPIDIDSDLVVDLMVLRVGENLALRGLGGCRFERANESWGIDGGDTWTAAFSAKWETGNDLPTLAFGNYLELPIDRAAGTSCADNTLLRPEGDRYGTPVPLSPGFCTLSVLFSNWDGSGQFDLRVANDRHYYIAGSDQMWSVIPGQEPRLYTEEEGWRNLKIWGMGIASQDVTGDGLPEFFITSQGDNKLQGLEDAADGPAYRDLAINFGVTAHRPHVGDNTFPSTAWHPEFQDVNNDGYLDLFITKGNVEAMVGYAMDDPNNLLLGQPDGTFVESAAEAGVASMARSRGAALVDFNLDGMLDLLVINRAENVQLWRNVGAGTAQTSEPMGNWLAVQPRLPAANRDAIGARITVRSGDIVAHREIAIGGGHAGDQLGWVHFGLGNADTASVSVIWEYGAIENSEVHYQDVKANSFVVLPLGDPKQYWTPPAP